jgi:hypothetical protein
MDGGLRREAGRGLRVTSAARAGRVLVLVEGEVDFTTAPGLADAPQCGRDQRIRPAAGFEVLREVSQRTNATAPGR